MSNTDNRPESNQQATKVKVKILGRDYHILCQPSDEENLKELISFLEVRLNDLKIAYPNSDNEQIVVLYALNLLKKSRFLEAKIGSTEERLQTMLFKVSE